MIQRLRVKFITASMLSLVLVLLVILGGVNAMSYRKIVQDAGHILELLSENRGAFPKALPPDGETGKPDRPLPPGNGLSPEAPFESRFFSVLLDGEGQVLQSDTGQIAAVDDQSAGEMAQAVWETGHTGGFWEDYRYVRVAENGGVRFIFWTAGGASPTFGRPCSPASWWLCRACWPSFCFCWSCPGGSSARWRRAMKNSAGSSPTPDMN